MPAESAAWSTYHHVAGPTIGMLLATRCRSIVTIRRGGHYFFSVVDVCSSVSVYAGPQRVHLNLKLLQFAHRHSAPSLFQLTGHLLRPAPHGTAVDRLCVPLLSVHFWLSDCLSPDSHSPGQIGVPALMALFIYFMVAQTLAAAIFGVSIAAIC